MNGLSGPVRFASSLTLLGTLGHAAAFVFAGMSAMGLYLLVYIILSAAVVAGFTRGFRSAAWVGFFLIAAGGIVALANVWSAGSVPPLLWQVIAALNLAAALALFGCLWAAPKTVDTA